QKPSDTMPGMTMPAPSPPLEKPMAGMDHSQMAGMGGDNMDMIPTTFIENIENHMSDGTSAEPNSTPVPMLMTVKHGWMLMLHGNAFFNVEQQSGPRGADKVFSTNWIMGMAQ